MIGQVIEVSVSPTRKVDDQVTATIEERVARGAAWLDDTRPGWRDAVKLDELRMASACQCICGQVFAAEADASRPIFCISGHGYDYAVREFSDSEHWALDHGFHTSQADHLPDPGDVDGDASEGSWDAYCDSIRDAWCALEAEWRRVVHTPAPTRVPA